MLLVLDEKRVVKYISVDKYRIFLLDRTAWQKPKKKNADADLSSIGRYLCFKKPNL